MIIAKKNSVYKEIEENKISTEIDAIILNENGETSEIECLLIMDLISFKLELRILNLREVLEEENLKRNLGKIEKEILSLCESGGNISNELEMIKKYLNYNYNEEDYDIEKIEYMDINGKTKKVNRIKFNLDEKANLMHIFSTQNEYKHSVLYILGVHKITVRLDSENNIFYKGLMENNKLRLKVLLKNL